MKKSITLILASILSFGGCYSQTWMKADNLHLKYLLESRYDSALYYADEAAALMRGTSGENNLQYADMLNKLSVSHFYLGNFKKAKYYILKEIELRESLKSTNDKNYLASLEDASVICRKAGSYEDALIQIKKAEKKALRIYGNDSPEYAYMLSSYAGVCHDLGCSINDMVYLKQEEEYLKKAELIYIRNGEKWKAESILCKSDQAAYNNNIGNSPQAESLLQEVVSYCKDKYGTSGTAYASSLNNLAVLYYNTGDYKLAEKYFVEAVDIYKKSPEAANMQTGICINNLGALYHDMGNYANAGRLLSDALKIMDNESGESNPSYAIVLNNIASVSLSGEYYASPENKSQVQLLNAGKLLLKADSIFKNNCQMPHPQGYSIGYNLSVWYFLTGNKKKATKMLTDLSLESNLSLKVVALMNKMSLAGSVPVSEGDHSGFRLEPEVIPIRLRLGDQISASSTETSGSAENDAVTKGLLELFIGKATNLKKAVGPYHPAYAEALRSLIIMYSSVEDLRTEEELTLEYINVLNHKIMQDFSFLSENEKELYYQTRLGDMNSFISYTLTRKRKNPAITCNAYNNILLNKGLMLKSSTAMRLAILNSNDPVLLKEYDEWISFQKEISVLYSTPVDMRTQDVAELEKKANALEKSLVTSSQTFNDYRKGLQITWDDVRKNLKTDEAAIEFTDFKKREKDGGDAVIYCALIVRPDSKQPEMIRLFTEDQLVAIIGKNGGNNIKYINDIYGTSGRQDDRLYNLIWKPIDDYLTGVKKVYISPSGLLFKISFPALDNGKEVYLCDKYQIQVKESTGNRAVQNLFSAGDDPSALVFGGIQYGQDKPELQVWSYLEGTKAEGDAINSILEKGHIKVNYLADNKATETYFKENARKYNILHLATHGFFFADPNEVRFEEKKQDVEYGQISFRGAARGFGVNSFVNNENPLMRSGLVLAGANDVWVNTEKSGKDDGVLTAQEVTQIDMRNNDLVVLSACETGLGDIKGSEGVYGLQRALKMAGVKFIIMSLWEIPDKETVEFMGTFYNNLLKVKDIKEAFFATQKTMRAKYDPYYWAAFVLME